MSAKTKATRITVPASVVAIQSRDEADLAIAEIGKLQRARQFIETRMNEELALVRQRHEDDAAPHGMRILNLALAVQGWANANRTQLTDDGKTKTVKLGGGDISWRLNPWSVVLRGAEKVLQALKDRKLRRFIRVKLEINKEALLEEKDLAALKAIKGLSFKQTEQFVIKPFETELEVLP